MTSNSGSASQIAGQWHTAKGELKHGVGRALASSELQREGQAERQAGRTEVNAARTGGQPQQGGGTGPGADVTGAGNDYGSGWKERHDQQYGGQQQQYDSDMGSTGNTNVPGTAQSTGTGASGAGGPETRLGRDDDSYQGEAPTSGAGGRAGENAFAPGGVPMGPGPERMKDDQFGQGGNTAAQSRSAQQNMDEWNRNAF